MNTLNCQLAVIGGGPAGMAAALSAWEEGVKDVVIIERSERLGGILPQCIHNGFGLHRFGEELTGPEYAQRYTDMLAKTGVKIMTSTMVVSLANDRTIDAISPVHGYVRIKPDAVVLAMGCRERTAGAISLGGFRPAGIFCAGTAQRYLNIEGYMVGKRAVILGSGDIGLIMARRLTLEGAKVEAVVELMPYSGGLNRNIVQCLHDFDIPLYLSHTITAVHGKERVTGVTVCKVGPDRAPVQGSQFEIDCDTLLLSVGLIPENELTSAAGIELDRRTNGAVVSEDMQTGAEGVFAAGNVLHVHDLVDFVSEEGQKAGKTAASHILGGAAESGGFIRINNGPGVNYTVPQRLHTPITSDVKVFFRVGRVFADSIITVKSGEKTVARFKREHMAPGEMERITLPAKLISGCDSLTVGAEEAQGGDKK